MKPFRLSLLLTLLALAGAWAGRGAAAAEEARPPEDASILDQLPFEETPGELPDETKLLVLERFLEMPPERIATIRATLERIEAMSREEKDALLERIREFRKLNQDKRRELMHAFTRIPPEKRALLRAYMSNLPPGGAVEVLREIRDLPPEARTERIEAMIAEARELGLEPRIGLGAPLEAGKRPGREERIERLRRLREARDAMPSPVDERGESGAGE